MRPSTAGQKKYDQQSARQIWKKYQNLRHENNHLFCFKTLSQILQSHQYKGPKQTIKKDIYYHKVSSPRLNIKDTTINKQSKKKNTSIFERNPNMKKTTLSNNFFSTKQLVGKQNNSDKNIALINKIRTEIQIKTQPKFLPYREQTMSIIKNSKILTDNQQGNIKQYCSVALHPHNNKQFKQTDHVKDNLKSIKKHQLRPKQKQKSHLQKEKKENIQQEGFLIQKWQDFDQQKNLSFLMVGPKKTK